ncbi:hypothetical protein [Sediminicola sp. YIK13]|uniref:hypothetical protein n=1 Tax=Sediminicola sp. YIK13 TaxID=1453352 RepID=UPI0011A765DA|nr:hypothetical protein [Sediminicola sp. YIK13]
MAAIFLLASCKEKKNDEKSNDQVELKREFSNKNMVPLIENCESDPTLSCLQNTISDIILEEAKKRKVSLINDTLQVEILVKYDGSTSILKNKTSNPLLEKISYDALSSLPEIEPAYTDFQNSYVNMSFSWFIIIQNDVLTNRIKE